ncbi:MAG: hypothetical protein NXH97_11945 [Rhodobacteraceae bacterium]|nr:hypothetical protein [Paracoccaceae bacterium]
MEKFGRNPSLAPRGPFALFRQCMDDKPIQVQTHAVAGLQQYDQTETGQVAIQGRGRPLSGLLNGVEGKSRLDAGTFADPSLAPVHQKDVALVAQRLIRAGLHDADGGLLPWKLLAGVFLVPVPLHREHGHAWFAGSVEPFLAAKPLFGARRGNWQYLFQSGQCEHGCKSVHSTADRMQNNDVRCAAVHLFLCPANGPTPLLCR